MMVLLDVVYHPDPYFLKFIIPSAGIIFRFFSKEGPPTLTRYFSEIIPHTEMAG